MGLPHCMTAAIPPSTLPWYRALPASPGPLILLGLGLGIAWQLGPAEFGALQAAVALAVFLAQACTLSLDTPLRDRLRGRPAEAMESIGTAMGLRAAAGVLVYCALLFLLPAQIGGQPRSVWLIAGLIVLLQAPLALSFRLEEMPRLPRRARRFGLAASALAAGLLLWHGAGMIWFAAAAALQPPLSALYLFVAHMRLAPEEEKFTWNLPLARRWLRHTPGRSAPLLARSALFSLAATVVIFSAGAKVAGVFAAGLLCLQTGYMALRSVGLFDQAPPLSLGEIKVRPRAAARLREAARLAWVGCLVLVALAVLLRYALRASGYSGVEWVLLAFAPGLLPLALGAVRNQIWQEEEKAQRVLLVQTGGLLIALAGVAAAALQWGALGAAIAFTVSLLLENLAAAFLFRDGRRLGRHQLRAFFLRPDEAAPKPKTEPQPAAPKTTGTSPAFLADTAASSLQDMGAVTAVARETVTPPPPLGTAGLSHHDAA